MNEDLLIVCCNVCSSSNTLPALFFTFFAKIWFIGGCVHTLEDIRSVLLSVFCDRRSEAVVVEMKLQKLFHYTNLISVHLLRALCSWQRHEGMQAALRS